VTKTDYSDAALVLIGHGSSRTRDAGAAVYQQADELRRRGHFARVAEGFWREEPLLKDVVRSAAEKRVFIVPLFMSEGYFSEQIIPAALDFHARETGELRRRRKQGDQTVYYCKPVGTHPRITAALLARARAVVEGSPFPRAPGPGEIDLFIAGHGTEQDENSREAIERQVEKVRSLDLYAGVHAIFLEEEPRVSRCYEIGQQPCFVVVPFFIGEGPHVREDIPVLLGQPVQVVRERINSGKPGWRNPTERRGKLVWYARSLGSDPVMSKVVLDRVREAATSSGD